MNRLFFTLLFVTLAIIAQSACASQVSLAEKKSQTGEREQLLQESRATNSSSPKPGQAIPTPKPTPWKCFAPKWASSRPLPLRCFC